MRVARRVRQALLLRPARPRALIGTRDRADRYISRLQAAEIRSLRATDLETTPLLRRVFSTLLSLGILKHFFGNGHSRSSLLATGILVGPNGWVNQNRPSRNPVLGYSRDEHRRRECSTPFSGSFRKPVLYGVTTPRRERPLRSPPSTALAYRGTVRCAAHCRFRDRNRPSRGPITARLTVN